MDSELFLNICNLSWETLVVAFLVFGLTMLLKWPIKKATSKLEENKRKAVNTVIIFIPIVLSILLNGLYYGIFKEIWFTSIVIESSSSIYILALAIYAIYSRIIIIIKGINGTSETNENLSKETISFIKKNIKTISKTLKIDEKDLDNIVSKIENLLKIREEITSNLEYQDIVTTENIDNQVNELRQQESIIKLDINKLKEQLTSYQNSIKKGE